MDEVVRNSIAALTKSPGTMATTVPGRSQTVDYRGTRHSRLPGVDFWLCLHKIGDLVDTTVVRYIDLASIGLEIRQHHDGFPGRRFCVCGLRDIDSNPPY